MSLQAALGCKEGDSCEFIGKILEKSTLQKYTVNGSPREYFTLTIADETESARVRVYQKSKLNTITIGKTYHFTQIIRKTSNGEFWATSSSKIFQTKQVTVPQEVIEQSKNDPSEENAERTLDQAMVAASTSRIQGMIVKISPLKRRRAGELNLRFLALRDASRQEPVKLAVFQKDAEVSYNIGDCVEATQVYKWTSPKQKKSLGIKKSGQVQFISNQNFKDISLEFSDSEDSDYLPDEEPEEAAKPFKIIGFEHLKTYQSCTKIGCHNKKVVDGHCPLCKSEDSTMHFFANAEVSYEDKTVSVTIFRDDIVKLTNPAIGDIENDEELMDALCELLPIEGKGLLQGKKISIYHGH